MADLVAAGTAPLPAPSLLAPLTDPAGGPFLSRMGSFVKQPPVRKVLPVFGGVAGIGLVALAWATLAPQAQRTLYSELDDGERAKVVATLDKAGIAYHIDNQTGSLTVGEDDLYKAKMLVASDGALAAPDDASSIDKLPLGASRAIEGDRLRAAREHDLTLSIMEIDGVEAVRVHLAEAEKSVFVRDNVPPSASVMVRLARGRQLSDSQVAAIVNLVAGSVPGLSPDAVRVVDQHGQLLTEKADGNSERLELQGRLESKLRTQLDQLLTPMVGAGNFSSEVQVELDMDQVTSARESYDKQGVLRTETQQQSQTAGAPGAVGVPGVTANTPPPAPTASPGPPQGTQPAATAPGATPTNGESSATRTYELGREVSVANGTPGKIKRLSVAVALSATALKKAKPQDIEQMKQLVSAAVGADPARGDQVAVVLRPFDAPVVDTMPMWQQPWFQSYVRYGLALLGVLLVLLLGVRPLINALKREPAAAPRREDEDEAEGAEGQGRAARPLPPPPVSAEELVEQVSLAQRIAAERPDDAVLALREMLNHTPAEPEAAA
ncbi:flagellar M-ring protein FliF [Novosphingobium flavum]|uniref:Flagellar M-ring protein n=1 Tax=Novosphingobium aerophilum TaxID=2839843 RepID=A0A7X1F818_9SPHN|nr:flagellar basal-body MS-ring/collar protein FliF [Novosphingobium aerophilum]MBC2652137.1 flagellar M-ring protein FliF [Novosphingobium aerophilum]MBC2661094.1 flagellar M-ring protein FliF [Novosphingobium aerophilum]